MASVRASIISNVFSQIYVAAIGIVMVPAYLHFMGAESYGLVGLYVALQTWFSLLDLGISPTLIREMSRMRAGAVSLESVWRFIGGAEFVFALLGLVSGLSIAFSATWIARHWLNLGVLPEAVAVDSMRFMGLMVGCRWLNSIYRSGLAGLDQLPKMNLASVLMTTVRAIGVLLVLAFWSSDANAFFAYQALVLVLEVLLFRVLFFRAMPGKMTKPFLLSRELFSGVQSIGLMAALTLIWGGLGQVDRVVLSHALSLGEFGKFSVVMVAASGVSLLAMPFTQALQPRLVFLAAGNDLMALQDLYRTSTHVLVWLLTVVAGTLFFFGENFLLIWTGDAALADHGASILAFYVLGNVFLALNGLMFQLQYAMGAVQRHFLGSVFFAAVWIPLICITGMYQGATGTALTWLIGNFLFVALWMLNGQSRLMPGLMGRWLKQDVIRIPLVCLPMLALLRMFHTHSQSRLGEVAFLCFCILVVGILGVLASPVLRVRALAVFRNFLAWIGKMRRMRTNRKETGFR